MSNTNNGGPAFPTTLYEHGGQSDGITLRDYFAGQALASINLGIGVTDDFYRRTATHCYTLADFMLKARKV